MRILPILAIGLCFSIPFHGQTKLELSKKLKISARKEGQPVYFKPQPINVKGYTDTNYSNFGASGGYFVVKSENTATGAEFIKKQIDEWMDSIGFRKSETSYFTTNAYAATTIANIEYRVDTETRFAELAKEVEFFNDRNEGEITGELKQIVLIIRIARQYWEDGNTIMSFLIHAHPIGLFKMNGKDAYWWRTNLSPVMQLFKNEVKNNKSEIMFFNEISDYVEWKSSLKDEKAE